MIGFAKGVLLCIAITFFAVTLLGQDQRERIIASRSGKCIVQILDKADAIWRKRSVFGGRGHRPGTLE